MESRHRERCAGRYRRPDAGEFLERRAERTAQAGALMPQRSHSARIGGTFSSSVWMRIRAE